MAEGNLGAAIAEARQALTEAHSLLAKLNSDVKDMRLKDTAVKANQVMDALAGLPEPQQLIYRPPRKT